MASRIGWWIAGLSAVALMVLRPKRVYAAVGADGEYPINSAKPYGPKWGSTPPPGWPRDVHTSVVGAAEPLIREVTGRQRMGPGFVAAMVQLARGESGLTFSIPQGRYNSLPVSERGGAAKLTAAGPYQVIAATWHSWASSAGVRSDGTDQAPARASALDQVLVPTLAKAKVWRRAKVKGWSDYDAGALVHIDHRSPSMASDQLVKGPPSKVGWVSSLEPDVVARAERTASEAAAA